jgi:hypothetical protein
MKFRLRASEVDRACVLLSARGRPIRFGAHDESLVSSIYFDDPTLSSCEESLAGVGRRIKLRARWYDRDFAADHLYFEVKIRQGLSVRKDRVRIALGRGVDAIPLPDLAQNLSIGLPAESAAMLALRPQPTVLVTYRRRHFRDSLSGARLTIDYDVVGFDLTNSRFARRQFGVALHDVALIEVKLPPSERFAAARMLAPLDSRPTRFSKYVMCCARIGWCSLSDHYH